LARSVEAGGWTALAIHAIAPMLQACKRDRPNREDSRSVDVFVNNAGILLAGTIDMLVSLSDLDKSCCQRPLCLYRLQAAARHMAEGGGIVTIGSIGRAANRSPEQVPIR